MKNIVIKVKYKTIQTKTLRANQQGALKMFVTESFMTFKKNNYGML